MTKADVFALSLVGAAAWLGTYALWLWNTRVAAGVAHGVVSLFLLM